MVKLISRDKLFLFIMLVGLLSAVSCKKNQNSPNLNTGNLIPLQVGNSWVYNIADSSSSTNNMVVDTNFTRSVESPVTFGSYSYYPYNLQNNETQRSIIQGYTRVGSYTISGVSYPAYFGYTNGPGFLLLPDSFTAVSEVADQLVLVDAPQGSTFSRDSPFVYVYEGSNPLYINIGTVIDTLFKNDSLYASTQYTITNTNATATINDVTYTGLYTLDAICTGYRAPANGSGAHVDKPFVFGCSTTRYKRALGFVSRIISLKFSEVGGVYQREIWNLISSSVK
ncbi:MAG: hypothetical protein QM528_03550 [Phycisphaerales bacterium]|nr:hypothetical protein [Phycisphaerales bacterium]